MHDPYRVDRPLRKVLIVDDDESIRAILTRLLTDAGYAPIQADSTKHARERLDDDAPDVVLLDLGLPDGSGLDLARRVIDELEDVAVVIVSGTGSPHIARAAVDLGVYGYVTKPFSLNAVLIAVHNACRRRDLEREHRHQHSALTAVVCERTSELEAALRGLEEAMAEARQSCDATVNRLSRAIEYRDPETSGHVVRMSRHCGLLAGSFGLDADAVLTAASMHDVGKIGIPDAVLRKPGCLTASQRLLMQRHTVIGHDLLTGSGAAALELAATIALTHHERWDGSGYPNGLAGSDIPLVGRIAAVADVLDAITQPRIYRPGTMTRTEALDFIRQEAGTHFDPAVVEALLANRDELDTDSFSRDPRAEDHDPQPLRALAV